MKIGIVTQSYYPKPGGVTEVVHYTARELERRGHDVMIITTRYSGSEKDHDGIVRIGRNIIVPVNGAWVNVTVGFGLKRILKEIFRREAFDIIQTHCPLVPTLPLITLKAALPHQKVVGTFHAASSGNIAYRLFRPPLERRARRLDLRLAVSEPAKRFASMYFPGPYEIIPNGVDCGRFRPGLPPIERLDDGALNILFVGRMDKRKGLPHLLRALPIAQGRLRRRIRLILVGEGRTRRMLMSKPLNINGADIHAPGRVSPDELPRYYSSADIFCSPATGRESFGIVLLEAMASGVPVIASDITGFKSVITDEMDGLLVPPKSPADIAEAILRLAGDEGLTARLVKGGLGTAQRYNWPIIADKLELAFSRLLGLPDRGRSVERTRITTG